MNSYQYALNNPVSYTDPDGQAVPLILAVALIGGGAGLGFAGGYQAASGTFDLGFTTEATFIGATAGLLIGIGIQLAVAEGALVLAGESALLFPDMLGLSVLTGIGAGVMAEGIASQEQPEEQPEATDSTSPPAANPAGPMSTSPAVGASGAAASTDAYGLAGLAGAGSALSSAPVQYSPPPAAPQNPTVTIYDRWCPLGC